MTSAEFEQNDPRNRAAAERCPKLHGHRDQLNALNSTPMAQQPLLGQGLFIIETLRSHSECSERVTVLSHRPLPAFT